MHISINVPHNYPDGWRYSLTGLSGNTAPLREAITYNTVADPADCGASLSKYYKVPENLAAETSWPLAASDYGRYYCIKVNLRVYKPSYDYRPYRVFLTDRTIVADGLNEYSDDFPDFSQTINQDTHYDDSVWVPPANRDYEFRDAYQAHLNNHFHLFSRYEGGTLDLRLVLPGHFAIANWRDINDFSLEYIEYATVTDRNDCDRDLFGGDGNDVTRDDNPTLSTSLTPAAGDYGRYYCIKVGIKGERTMSFDYSPYRVFYVPQIIMNPNPDDAWLYF